MNRRPPSLADWLLTHCGAQEELIGDLHEIFASSPSRCWYWRQVILILALLPASSITRFEPRNIQAIAAAAFVTAIAVYSLEALETGWVEAELAAGHSKVVPAISFRLRNVSEQSLPVVQVNAVFHRGRDAGEWGNAFRTAAGSAGLAAGQATRHLVLWSQTGYTGVDIPADLLENSHFVDATVDLYGRFGSKPWAKLGEFAIVRTLINP